MGESLQEINDQIRQLNEKRKECLKGQAEERERIIKSLEWTKDCDASLEISRFRAIGIPAYQVFLSGNVPETPEYNSQVTVFGESPAYQYNVLYQKTGSLSLGDARPHFFTSCEKALKSFLSTVKFRSFKFDEQTLDLLKFAEGKKFECEYDVKYS